MMFFVDSAIKSSAVLACALLAARLLRGRSAALRHCILSVAMLCAALIPAFRQVMPSLDWHVAAPSVRPAAPITEPPLDRKNSGHSALGTIVVGRTSVQPAPAAPSEPETPHSRVPSAIDPAAVVQWIWLAGVALAFKAISEKDRVGLVVFGTEVKDAVPPTDDFGYLLQHITRIMASRQTDFAKMIRRSIELFPGGATTKHLIILTDALPTVGEEPERATIEAVSMARAQGITISLIGVQLDKKGIALAEQMARLGEGRFTVVQDLENLDRLVLQDYYALAAR